MNNVILLGRLTADPKTRTTNSGLTTCSFSLAVQRNFKNANGTYDADFINCVAWRGTAETIAKYFTKGAQICVRGSWQVRSYEAQDGSKRTVSECIVEGFDFVGSRQQNQQSAVAPSGFVEVDEDDDGSLPF